MSGRYAEAHKFENLRGAGDARPTGLQIVKDEYREGDLSDKVIIITGTSSGIGPPTAAALAATGATIYCTARDLERGRKALGPLLDSPKVHLLHMDLGSLASVKAFADEFRARESRLNVLVNNAGVMMLPTRELTSDGFETQIGTNHLAHFYLFCLLRDVLLVSATPAFASRVVNVASSGHRYAPARLDDLNFEKTPYDPAAAYGASKTANVHMANQLDRLYGGRGLHGYSVTPGGVFTPLQRHIAAEIESVRNDPRTMAWMKSPEQGCATTVWAAVARELEGRGGLYLENCAVAEPAPPGLDETGQDRLVYGHAAWAYDRESEEGLWELSLELVGLKGRETD